MLIVLAFAIASPLIVSCIRLVVAVLATMLGVFIAFRFRRALDRVTSMQRGGKAVVTCFDRQPSLAERRALRASLDLAIMQTEFSSLLPAISPRAQRIAMMLRCQS